MRVRRIKTPRLSRGKFITGQPSAKSIDPRGVVDKVVELIESGNYAYVAAQKAGISYSTFSRWMRWGEHQEIRERPNPLLIPLYEDFARAVRAAEARCEVEVVNFWWDQLPGNWQAARDFLARRFPERWGPKEQHIVESDNVNVVELKFPWELELEREHENGDLDSETP